MFGQVGTRNLWMSIWGHVDFGLLKLDQVHRPGTKEVLSDVRIDAQSFPSGGGVDDELLLLGHDCEIWS